MVAFPPFHRLREMKCLPKRALAVTSAGLKLSRMAPNSKS